MGKNMSPDMTTFSACFKGTFRSTAVTSYHQVPRGLFLRISLEIDDATKTGKAFRKCLEVISETCFVGRGFSRDIQAREKQGL
jgi:hypothetical protein